MIAACTVLRERCVDGRGRNFEEQAGKTDRAIGDVHLGFYAVSIKRVPKRGACVFDDAPKTYRRSASSAV